MPLSCAWKNENVPQNCDKNTVLQTFFNPILDTLLFFMIREETKNFVIRKKVKLFTVHKEVRQQQKKNAGSNRVTLVYYKRSMALKIHSYCLNVNDEVVVIQ